MGDDAGGLERRAKPFLDMARFVRLVADQDEGVRGILRGRRLVPAERGERDGQLPVDMLDVFRRRVVVGHRDEIGDGDANLVEQAGERPALGDVVADLPAELGQEPALAGDQAGPAPRARPRDDMLRPERLELSAMSRPIAPCRCRRARHAGRGRPAGRAKRTPGPDR